MLGVKEARLSLSTAHPFLKCIHIYANRAKIPNPSIEMVVTGVQKRRILRGLLLRRLAAKNNAKNERVRTQNNGEERLSRKPATTAVNPIALVLLTFEKAPTRPGASRATSIAATALRAPRRYVT
jgi:hypothetical protein